MVFLEHFVDGPSGNRVPHTRSEITVHCHRDTSNSSCTWLFVSVEFQIPHGDSSWRSFSVILAILMFDSALKMFGEVKCLSFSGSKVLTYRRLHALVLVIVSRRSLFETEPPDKRQIIRFMYKIFTLSFTAHSIFSIFNLRRDSLSILLLTSD